jgi:hypothetical protein
MLKSNPKFLFLNEALGFLALNSAPHLHNNNKKQKQIYI